MFVPDDADDSWFDMEIPAPPRIFYLEAIQKADAELRGDMPKHEFYGSFLIR